MEVLKDDRYNHAVGQHGPVGNGGPTEEELMNRVYNSQIDPQNKPESVSRFYNLDDLHAALNRVLRQVNARHLPDVSCIREYFEFAMDLQAIGRSMHAVVGVDTAYGI